MTALAFPNGKASSFGNLPVTDPGVTLDLQWLIRALRAGNVPEDVSDAVLDKLGDLTVAMSVLVHRPIGLQELEFQLGGLQREKQMRPIHVYFQGHEKIFKKAVIEVLVSETTGELFRPFNVALQCHDDR